MSEASTGLYTSAEQNVAGPDYFRYYTRVVAELLSQDEDFLPFSSKISESVGKASRIVKDKDVAKHDSTLREITGSVGTASLFCEAAGAGLSDVKKERLKALLRQSVVALTREVDEQLLDPVISMCRLQALMRHTKSSSSYPRAPCEDDTRKDPQKKPKLLSSSSSVDIPLHDSPVSCNFTREGSGDEHKGVAVPGKYISNGCNKQCANCYTSVKSKQSTGPEGPKSLCAACFKRENESLSIKDQELFWGSSIGAERDNGEVNDDLQILLEYGGAMVEEKMKKHSDELSGVLVHMEQKLEELLDMVMSSCRPMTLAEKHQLRRLIQKLPPKNLDRVAEIIRRGKPAEEYSCEEIHVDLEKEDNATLWKLYFYVEAVESARKL